MKRTRGRRTWSLYAALGVLGPLLISACGTSGAEIVNTPVPALTGQAGNFDNVVIDQGNHRLYAADRTDQGVDVFDISWPRAKFIKTIALSSPPNGLAISSDYRLYAGMENGSVAVVDVTKGSSSLLTVLAEVKTGAPVDLLDYNGPHHMVVAANGGTDSITIIDTLTNEVKDHFKVGSALEQPRLNDADGLVYVTSPDADALIQIDPTDGTVKNRFALDGCNPTGLAINPTLNAAVIACKNHVLTFDIKTGKTTKFTQVAGGDIVTYDAKVDRFFVASPHKIRASVIGMFGGKPIDYIASIPAPGRGNSAAFDETNDIVYSPDTRLNQSGVAGTLRPTRLQEATPGSIAIYGAMVMFIALLFWFVMRTGDPLHRHGPAPVLKAEPAPAVKPMRSWRRTPVEPAVEGPPAPSIKP
jgi:DNA-binding beta-propeller fold protein YncE